MTEDILKLELIRHDAAHVMAMAVQELFPGTQVTIGPVIENGFYYDFARKEPFTSEDLNKIEKRMAEIIVDMLTNRLWIYTAIAGSLLGAAFLFWFKDTKMATWAVSKFDRTLEYLVNRWGWTWLQNDPDAWRKKYPRITTKIDELEERIKQLEKFDDQQFKNWFSISNVSRCRWRLAVCTKTTKR